jgi:PA14 domain
MAFASAGPIKWSELNCAYGFGSNSTFSFSNVRASTEGASYTNISLSNIQNMAIPYAGYLSRRKLAEATTPFSSTTAGDTIFNNTKGVITYVSDATLPNEDYYGCEYNGLIKLTESGTHSFYLTSDDASELQINGTLVANNGYNYAGTGATGTISLNAGVYSIRVRFQEWTGGQSLAVNYQSPSAGAFSALNFSTQCAYAYKPYIKLDANHLVYGQGVSVNSAISTWSNMGTDGTAVHATGASGNSSGNPILTQDTTGYMVTFDRTKQQYFTLGSLTFDKFRSQDNLDINGLTIITVMRISHSSPGSYERIFEFGNGSSAADTIIFFRDGTSSTLGMYLTNGGSTASPGKNITSSLDGAFHVYALQITNGSTSTFNTFIDGYSITTADRSGFSQGNITNRTISTNYIGRSTYSSDAYFAGDIRELQIYREVIPTALLTQMSMYLMRKWNIKTDVGFITNGLIGYYTGESWTGSVWNDISPSANNATSKRGTPINNSVTLNGFKCLSGGTSDGLQFPSGLLPSGYTLFHVAKHNGASRNRIFDAYAGGNWCSGFQGGQSGKAFHGGWLTPQTDVHGTNWVLSTDQKDLYKSNGVQRSTTTGSLATVNFAINYGSFYPGESSDFAVACVIAYNRTLSSTEITQMELYLNRKYSVY